MNLLSIDRILIVILIISKLYDYRIKIIIESNQRCYRLKYHIVCCTNCSSDSGWFLLSVSFICKISCDIEYIPNVEVDLKKNQLKKTLLQLKRKKFNSNCKYLISLKMQSKYKIHEENRFGTKHTN